MGSDRHPTRCQVDQDRLMSEECGTETHAEGGRGLCLVNLVL